MAILNYLLSSIWNGIIILAAGLLPWLAAAFLLQLGSNWLRKSLTRLLGVNTWVYLTFPGVAIHELSHAFFCLVFRHKIHDMKLFSPEDDGTLGYVNHAYDPGSYYQRAGNFFIGTGPIWGGVAVLYLLSCLLLPKAMLPLTGDLLEDVFAFISGIFTIDTWRSIGFYVWLYFALTITSHITLSPPDLKGAWEGLQLLVVLVFAASLLLGWCGDWETVVAEKLWAFFSAMLPVFSISIAILFIAVLLLRLLPRFR